MALTGSIQPADAERQLQDAIDLGELTAQHAPAGHPIFAALSSAHDALEWLQDGDNPIPPTIAPGSRVYGIIDGALEGVYQASADVRNVPDQPLPRTIFAAPATSIPWIPITAAGAALLLGWYLFRAPATSRRTP